VLIAPGDLDEAALARTLRAGWEIHAASMTYLAVGWGSHHWDVRGRDGQRWFVTVDLLENKRVSERESLADGFARLRASLLSAVALREAGCEFVVAPVPGGGQRDGERGATQRGEPALRFGGRFAAAVYPFTDGQSFDGDAPSSVALRSAMLAMVADVHQAPERARLAAFTDDFRVPFADLVEGVLDGATVPECGPYTRPVADLLREYAAPVRQWLDQCQALAAVAGGQPGRNVLTHGEPHPGNAMLTTGGWRLIDWDTALIAPPERDLWSLAADEAEAADAAEAAGRDRAGGGNGAADASGVLDAYAAATGVRPRPELIEFYRLRWDVSDLAYDTARFFRPHAGTAEDAETWELLSTLIRRTAEG
jgi:spectinomycin phosphotransferase/16S rRNA (guanine(1405)-N(7))-methyltransferase